MSGANRRRPLTWELPIRRPVAYTSGAELRPTVEPRTPSTSAMQSNKPLSPAPSARFGAQRRLPIHGEHELHTLIELAYEAAGQRDRWPALLEGLARQLGCEVVGINLQDLERGRASLHSQFGVDPSWRERYESYYARRNIFLSARPDLTFTGAIRNGEAIVPDREAMRTEYFNDFLRPLGILHAIGMVPFRSGSVIALVSLMRRLGTQSFTDADFTLLDRLD